MTNQWPSLGINKHLELITRIKQRKSLQADPFFCFEVGKEGVPQAGMITQQRMWIDGILSDLAPVGIVGYGGIAAHRRTNSSQEFCNACPRSVTLTKDLKGIYP